MTLNDCLDAFIEYQHLKNNSKITIANYSIIIKKFIDFVGNKDSKSLTAYDVNMYNLYLRDSISSVSVRTYIRHIRVFVSYMIKQRYCNNIYDDIVLPRIDKTVVDILSPVEVEKLLSVFGDDFYSVRNKCMVLLMLDCGLRASEVVGLLNKNINYIDKYIKVLGKGGKERIVPFGNSVELSFYMLNNLYPKLKNKHYYFCDRSCKPLTTDVFKKMFLHLRDLTGISRLHPHLLRHTFATNYLLYSDGDIFQLAMLLGHSTSKTTEIYLHIANYYKFMLHKNIFSFVDNEIKNKM